MDRRSFYDECSRILGTLHAFRVPPRGKITRWNNRNPGNGRFPGYGLVRRFGPNCVQIALRQPVEFNLVCHSEEEALSALRSVCERSDENQTPNPGETNNAARTKDRALFNASEPAPSSAGTPRHLRSPKTVGNDAPPPPGRDR